MPNRTSASPMTLAALSVVAMMLTACEFRRDDGMQEPAPDAGETATLATPAPTPSETETAAASIIRDENAPESAVELPPEPVEVTLPFPDGPNLSPGAERMLAGIMSSRAVQQDWPVVLGGHTDSGGNDQANLRASRASAEAVAAWLVERGVSDDRIEVIAFGEQNPIAPNALPNGEPNAEGRRANRRVELRIAPTATEREREANERLTNTPR